MIDDAPTQALPSAGTWSADQFAAILRSVADGVTVQNALGALVYANTAALRLLRFERLDDLLATPVLEVVRQFDIFDEQDRPLTLDELPGRQALLGVPGGPLTVRFRILATGEDRWAVVHATPVFDAAGRTEFVINTFHDITERVFAERVNRTQAHLLDEVRAAVVAADVSGAITNWNAFAESLLGWSPDLVLGRHVLDVLVEPSARDAAARLLQHVNAGFRWEGEIDVRDRHGTVVPLLVTLAPIRTGRQITGIVGVAVDITERRHTEQELRAGMERQIHDQQAQKFLADASRLLAESLDEDATIERLARLAVPSIADWCVIDLVDDRGELRAVGIAHADEAKVELARRLRRDYPPVPNDSTGTYAVVRSGKSRLVSEIPAALVDAIEDPTLRETLRALELGSYMSVPLIANGRPLGAITFLSAESHRPFGPADLAIAEDLAGRAATALENARLYRDVTHAQAGLERLAEAEHSRAAELNAVIGAMREAVLVVQPDGAITLANPAVDTLLPAPRPTTYAELLAFFDGGDRAPALGDTRASAELRLRGEPERWLELSTSRVTALPNEPTGEPPGTHRETIVLIRDITAARQRQAVRDTFLGVLSHELRTPITTIFAGAKVLARPTNHLTDSARSELFTDISVEAERLHRLVEDVIALNRFGEADGEIGQEPVLLQRILPAVIATEEPRWPLATFSLDMPAGLPTVSADKTYVEQVLRNLLSNAAKYAGRDARVAVDVDAVGDEVRVRVLDNGPGFRTDEADRLFELFYRSPSTSGAVSGAGIGLFVCARLIDAMGGRVWAAPRADGGAEFGFALRVMADD